MTTLEDDLLLIESRMGGNPAFRRLCDPTQPGHNPGYIDVVRRMASEMRSPSTVVVQPAPVTIAPKRAAPMTIEERRRKADEIRAGSDGSQTKLLAAVMECEHRGNVLPLSQQSQGCGQCGERYSCLLGRGVVPGAPTSADCLRCKAGEMGLAWG